MDVDEDVESEVMVGKAREQCLEFVNMWSLVERGMMVDVRRVLGNWAVCSVKTDAEAVAELDFGGLDGVEDEVVRVVSYSSPIFTVNDRS